MKVAIIALPRFERLRQLILRQLARLDHTLHVIEERRFVDGGRVRLELPANVAIELVERFDDVAIAARVERHGIDEVLSFADRGLVLAARVRERLGMAGNSSLVEARVAHKGLTRRRLFEGGLSGVRFRVTTIDRLGEDLRDEFLPVIVKPTSLGGSLYVQLLEDLGQLPQYIARCRAGRMFGDQADFIIEQYIPGPELSVEGIVSGGRVELLGVTESHTTGSPYFVGAGYDFFARHEDAPRLHAFVTDVIRCLQLDDCPFQVELKPVGDGFEVIEVHTRFAGAMIMELVERATGVQVFSRYIEILAGLAFHRPPAPDDDVYALHLLCSPPGVIAGIRLGPEVTEDPRVLSVALDVSAGDAVGADVAPLEPVGHVTFRATDRADARRFHAFVDRHFHVELRRDVP